MYTRITHTIVEEHFDHPMAVDVAEGIKKTRKVPLKCFPNGEQMSSNLPPSFRIAIGDNRCGNCLAFDPATAICSKWSAMVSPEYVCDAWTVIPS